MNESTEYEDWLHDFGARPKSDAELQRMREAAAGEANSELRLLIKEAQCMRWAARALLEKLKSLGWSPEPSDGKVGDVFQLAAHLVECRSK